MRRSWYEIAPAAHTGLIPGRCANQSAGLTFWPQIMAKLVDMIFLIHLLEHMGLPSGAAIAVVIAARKLLKAGTSRVTGHRGHDRGRRSAGGYR